MVTVGLTFFFNMVSVDDGHFKGHRLPKGTHLNFQARLFKGRYSRANTGLVLTMLTDMYSYCYRIRANRALNILAQNIAVNCKHLSY